MSPCAPMRLLKHVRHVWLQVTQQQELRLGVRRQQAVGSARSDSHQKIRAECAEKYRSTGTRAQRDLRYRPDRKAFAAHAGKRAQVEQILSAAPACGQSTSYRRWGGWRAIRLARRPADRAQVLEALDGRLQAQPQSWSDPAASLPPQPLSPPPSLFCCIYQGAVISLNLYNRWHPFRWHRTL